MIAHFQISPLVLLRWALLVGLLGAASSGSAATVTTADKAGATWTGFGSGIPDLSGVDHLDGLTTPFTVGTGSVVHAASAPLTSTGLAVLNNSVGSTTNNQTIILGGGSTKFVRLMIDLQAGEGTVFVEEFNSYGMVTSDDRRHYQRFDLYGSNATSSPVVDGDPATNGWSLIANVDQTFTQDTGRTNGVHVDDIDQEFRFLLLHARASNTLSVGYPGNHFVELDVVGTLAPPPVPEPSAGMLFAVALVGLLLSSHRSQRLKKPGN